MNYFRKNNFSRVEANEQRGNVLLCLVVFFGLIFLSVVYLTQVNALVGKSFELRSAQKSLDDQKEKNQRLSVSLTQAQSLSNLEAKAKDFNLVPIEQTHYLKSLDNSLAVSR